MSVQTFFNSLPKYLLDLVHQINRQGFRVGFIGGITRDFLLNQTLGVDFDCELRPINYNNLDEQWDSLYHYLDEKFHVQMLPYKIIRLKLDDIEIELTLPRIETFNGKKGHSNFNATFISDQDYSQGFKRRDFTVNAIMYEKYLDKITLIDPLNGIEHLNMKQLFPCSDNFAKDPVRFLRALRFKFKLGFSFSYGLSYYLKNMKVEGLSIYHIKEELKKSNHIVEMFLTIVSCKKNIFLHEETFHKHIKHLRKLANCFPNELNSIVLLCCFFSRIDIQIRKDFVNFWETSVKKCTFFSHLDFNGFKIDKNLNELIKDNQFIEFCELIEKIRKFNIFTDNERLLKIMMHEYKIRIFSPSQFKKICFSPLKLTSDDREKFSPNEFKYVLIAKMVLSL